MKDRLFELLNEATFGVNENTLADYLKKETIDRVADYLLANGVIVFPCKVGDTVYWYNMGGEIVEAKVKMLGFSARHSKGFEYDVPFDNIGKTVFLTKAEAEKALAERSGS